MAIPAHSTISAPAGSTIHGGWWAGGRLAGAVALDLAQAAGALGTNVADLGGGVDLDAAAAAGDLRGLVVPAWVGAVGEWSALPNSNWLSSGVAWAGANPGAYTMGPRAVLSAWSGAVLNTVGVWISGVFTPGTFLILWGGGHGDWSGNEVYAYGPLDADSPVWRRIIDPSVPGANDTDFAPDGRPVSRHTYDTLHYDPVTNKMFACGRQGNYQTGLGTTPGGDMLDFGINPLAANPWSAHNTGFPSGGGGGVGSIDAQGGINPVTRLIWQVQKGNGNYLVKRDIDAGTWTAYAKDNPNGAPDSKGSLDYLNNLLVTRGTSGQILVQNLASPTSALYTPSVTGSAPAAGDTAMDWDHAGGRHAFWSGGKTLWFLTPGANPAPGGDAWTWTSTTPAGGATPAAAEGNGTFGRFRVATFQWGRGVLLLPNYNAPAVFYRMT